MGRSHRRQNVRRSRRTRQRSSRKRRSTRGRRRSTHGRRRSTRGRRRSTCGRRRGKKTTRCTRKRTSRRSNKKGFMEAQNRDSPERMAEEAARPEPEPGLERRPPGTPEGTKPPELLSVGEQRILKEKDLKGISKLLRDGKFKELKKHPNHLPLTEDQEKIFTRKFLMAGYETGGGNVLHEENKEIFDNFDKQFNFDEAIEAITRPPRDLELAEALQKLIKKSTNPDGSVNKKITKERITLMAEINALLGG